LFGVNWGTKRHRGSGA